MNFIDIAYASEEVAESTETAQDNSLLGSLGINGSLFAFQLINFAIVAAILWFLILKPLTKKMTERQNIIDESLDNAKKMQENLARSEKDYQAKIDIAKVEANRILEKTNTEAGILANEMKVKAKKEIEGLVEQARKNIKIEKEEMVAKFKNETANIIVVALEKILSEKVDEQTDKKLIEETLKGLKS